VPVRNAAAFTRKPKYRQTLDILTFTRLDKEQLEKKLRDRFRQGALDACRESVRCWLEREMNDRVQRQELRQSEVARWLGVKQSTVSRWMEGRTITLENLVALLIQLDGEFDRMNLPVRETLVVEGYMAAMRFVQEKLGLRPGLPIHGDHFWVLCSLVYEDDWVDALKTEDPERRAERLEKAYERILREARGVIGRDPRDVTCLGDLKRLVKDWAPAWVVCLYHLDERTWALQRASQ
jgi:predicted XRE-type DNA-binding protein